MPVYCRSFMCCAILSTSSVSFTTLPTEDAAFGKKNSHLDYTDAVFIFPSVWKT